MITRVDRGEVQTLLAGGAQLVDPLPRSEYEEERVAGAISVPLKDMSAATTAMLDRSAPVIVYCFDHD